MVESYEGLIARIRYHIQKANFMGLKEHEGTLLLKEAADAIEGLLAYCNSQEDAIKDLVDELDKVERKHGKWESVDDVFWLCSKCHYPHSRSKFCPNCGADMRESEEKDDNPK